MTDKPFIILGCERREYREPSIKGYIILLLVFAALNILLAATMTFQQRLDDVPQELLSTDREMPEQVATTNKE